MKHARHTTAIGLALVVAMSSATAAQAANLRLMTGPQGGAWVPLGGQLKDMWERAVAGLSVQSLPGAGIANVRGIEEGKTDLGFGNSISTVDAVAGREPFKKPHENVCNLASLYPQYFQVVVRADSGVNAVRDLKGKAIAVQPRGNTAEEITRQILQVNGLSYKEVRASFVSYSDAVTQVQDGHAIGMTLGTTVPSGAVMDLASAREIKVLDLAGDLAAMRKLNPGYTLNTIAKGLYPKLDAAVQVIGYATHLVVSCKLAPDTVYSMARTIAENTKQLSTIVKDIATLTPKGMAEDIGVPFHAGAARFYKEAGVTVQAR